MFWSLFGQIDHENFNLDERGYEVIWTTGMLLFGVFNIVAVLVAVNMLIAMLNESYTRITVSTTLLNFVFSYVSHICIFHFVLSLSVSQLSVQSICTF